MLSIRLPAEVELRISNLAERTGRTKTSFVREAVLEYLNDLEDLYEAEQRMIEVKTGKSRVYTAQEVEEQLGL